MTVDILAGDDAGVAGGDVSAPAGDVYETAQTFESLGVGLELAKTLANQGITTAFPIQAMTIADALSGRDVSGKAKTGSGKTLAFGLPLLQRTAAQVEAAGPVHSGGPAPVARPGPGPHEGARAPGAPGAGAAGQGRQPAQRGRLRRVGHGSPDQGPPPRGRRGHRHAGPADRSGGAGRGLRRRRRDGGPRRGRSDGRHGFHAPGRVGPPPGGAPPSDPPLLRHPGRGRRPAHPPLPAGSRASTRSLHTQTTVAAMLHRFLQVHQMDKVKVAAAIAGRYDKTLVFVRTKRGADRLVEKLAQGGRQGGGDPRRPPPEPPGESPLRLHRRPASRARGHRRGGPGAATSRASTW